MNFLVFYGKKDNFEYADKLIDYIYNYFTIIFIKEKSKIIKKGNSEKVLIVLDVEDISDLYLDNAIIIFKDKIKNKKDVINITNLLSVMESINMDAIDIAKRNRMQAVIIGSKYTDTLTYSSNTENNIMISLLRNMESISKKLIYPVDILVVKTKDEQSNIYLTIIFLLLYFDIDINYNEKILI